MRPLVLAMVTGAAVIAALPGSAAAPARPVNLLEQERTALARALADAKAAARRSATLERQADSAVAEADKARAEARVVASRVQQAEAEIAAAEARVKIIATLQRAQRARLAARQQPLARLTAALQSMARRPTMLALVQPGSIDDLVRVRAVLATTLPRVEAETAALRKDIARSRDLARQANRAAALQREGRQQLAYRRAELARLEARARNRSRELASTSRLEEERALGLSERARDLDSLVGDLEASATLRQQLAALEGPVLRPPRPQASEVIENAPAPASSARPAYRLPAAGAIVTGFGEVAATGVRSRGLTLATRPGAQLIAPADGRIAFAGAYRGFGQIVIIEHVGGWTSLITGLARTKLKVGERIAQGDPLGRAADNRPRITVELRRNGRPIDIAALLS
ncbi:murein hydrolase activator EnvC family protein [Sphingomonas ursincola]|uniref:murein hydrolase activator EnvC family protein n=1 Tax=Sphingomonas ursincola TaxID=56361 RepID=UPI002355265B|nr:peptidoglycan DD-metalloendopeptidase family protein [Sphingomonas ursincola]MBY0619403.1 peptidoglycan DD-metalloendopeptidase family protein [Sphingomonas ursincola]